MIRNFIYYMPIVISVIGILSIVFALKNNSRNNNKLIIVFNIINILYLFIISTLMHNLLPIIVDLTILIIWPKQSISFSYFSFSNIKLLTLSSLLFNLIKFFTFVFPDCKSFNCTLIEVKFLVNLL